MEKITFLVLMVFFLITTACKKGNSPSPEPKDKGCELSSVTSVSNGKTCGGFTYFYEKGNLYSMNSSDSLGIVDTEVYTRYKFSGGKLAEFGVVWGQLYTKEKQFEYDNQGRISLIKWFLQSNSNSYTAYRFYYDNAGNCNHILMGKVTVDSTSSTATITDSIGFASYTALGKPQYLMQYTYKGDGTLIYHGGYKYEYDNMGNCTKFIDFSPTKESIQFECEYNLNTPLNSEYIDLQKVTQLIKYHPYSSEIPPVKDFVSQYAKIKKSFYSGGQVSLISYIDNKFDSLGRLISYGETYSNALNDTSFLIYTYSCN